MNNQKKDSKYVLSIKKMQEGILDCDYEDIDRVCLKTERITKKHITFPNERIPAQGFLFRVGDEKAVLKRV